MGEKKFRHELEERWHEMTWCAEATSCQCGCIPTAERIAEEMCDRIAFLESLMRGIEHRLTDIIARRAYGSIPADDILKVVLDCQSLARWALKDALEDALTNAARMLRGGDTPKELGKLMADHIDAALERLTNQRKTINHYQQQIKQCKCKE